MTRFDVFESLRKAHNMKWDGYNDRCLHPSQGNPLFTWWMQWWSILEGGFPEYLKDGSLTGQYDTDKRHKREETIRNYNLTTPTKYLLT